ncbi:hypothetical protein [Pseudomonas sp. FG-3G]|nr:hypothetical protein [Pseudomonas sp. FG-3G]
MALTGGDSAAAIASRLAPTFTTNPCGSEPARDSGLPESTMLDVPPSS